MMDAEPGGVRLPFPLWPMTAYGAEDSAGSDATVINQIRANSC
jgi:hypothetical protein